MAAGWRIVWWWRPERPAVRRVAGPDANAVAPWGFDVQGDQGTLAFDRDAVPVGRLLDSADVLFGPQLRLKTVVSPFPAVQAVGWCPPRLVQPLRLRPLGCAQRVVHPFEHLASLGCLEVVVARWPFAVLGQRCVRCWPDNLACLGLVDRVFRQRFGSGLLVANQSGPHLPEELEPDDFLLEDLGS